MELVIKVQTEGQEFKDTEAAQPEAEKQVIWVAADGPYKECLYSRQNGSNALQFL
jgi:hypothetical protein